MSWLAVKSANSFKGSVATYRLHQVQTPSLFSQSWHKLDLSPFLNLQITCWLATNSCCWLALALKTWVCVTGFPPHCWKSAQEKYISDLWPGCLPDLLNQMNLTLHIVWKGLLESTLSLEMLQKAEVPRPTPYGSRLGAIVSPSALFCARAASNPRQRCWKPAQKKWENPAPF